MFRLLIYGIILAAAYYGYQSMQPLPPIKRQAGIYATEDPIQQAVLPTSWRYKDATVTPLANYFIKARVLATEHYYFDDNASYAPIDVAVGWKNMSDNTLLNQLKISQSSRWYFVEWQNPINVTEAQIFSESANMHLIAANKTVAQKIEGLRPGHIITLKGYLVRLNRADGFTWSSSTSRSDTGDGSCELMWVEQILVQ